MNYTKEANEAKLTSGQFIDELQVRYEEYKILCQNGDVQPMDFQDWQEWDTNVYQKHVREAASPLTPDTLQRLQETQEGHTREELKQMVEDLKQENEDLIATLTSYESLAKQIYQKLETFQPYKEAWDKWETAVRVKVVESAVDNLYDAHKWLDKEFYDIPIRTTPVNQPLFPHYFVEVPEDTTHIDIYWVLKQWQVVDPCVQHAVKKLFAAGRRGAKNIEKDLAEARDSITRALELK